MKNKSVDKPKIYIVGEDETEYEKCNDFENSFVSTIL